MKPAWKELGGDTHYVPPDSALETTKAEFEQSRIDAKPEAKA